MLITAALGCLLLVRPDTRGTSSCCCSRCFSSFALLATAGVVIAGGARHDLPRGCCDTGGSGASNASLILGFALPPPPRAGPYDHHHQQCRRSRLRGRRRGYCRDKDMILRAIESSRNTISGDDAATVHCRADRTSLPSRQQQQQQRQRRSSLLPSSSTPLLFPSPPPYLAIVTEPDSCHSEGRLQQSLRALEQALLPRGCGRRRRRVSADDGDAKDEGDNDADEQSLVAMVIVRLDDAYGKEGDADDNVPRSPSLPSPKGSDDEAAAHEYRQRVNSFVKTLVKWSAEGHDKLDDVDGNWTGRPKFLVLLSSGLLVGHGDKPTPLLGDDEIVMAAHGVHVKESHRARLPELARRFDDNPKAATGDNEEGRTLKRMRRSNLVVGMSCHSVASAVEAFQQYRPDYLLVGTCYPTLSHPEKSPGDVEGPDLPGRVRRELEQRLILGGAYDNCEETSDDVPRLRPVVLGIGGIDSTNCGRVLEGGADGVAVIRSVLANPNPGDAVRRIREEMGRI